MVTVAALGLVVALAILVAFKARSRPATLTLMGAAAGAAAGLAMGVAAALIRAETIVVLGRVAFGGTIWAPVLFGLAGAALGLLTARNGKVRHRESR